MKAAGVEAALIAVVQGGLVAVMAVGDDKLLFFHRGLNGRGTLWIGDDPQAVHHAIFIAQRGRGSVRTRRPSESASMCCCGSE